MEKINHTDLLLVIDMQNVYRPGEEWSCDSFEKTLSNTIRLINKFPKENVAFTKFIADEDAKGVWAEYNQENKAVNDSEYLNDMVDDLKTYINKDNSYVKSTYSSLKNQKLLKKLDKYNRVFVTGVVAECCVLSTVFELIDAGKKVIYVKDGVSGENILKEHAVILALEGIEPLHIEFVNTAEIME